MSNLQNSTEKGPAPLERILSLSAVVGFVWLLGLIAALGVISLPSSVRGWLLLLFLGPPAALLGEVTLEFVFRAVLNTRSGRWLEERQVSTLRGTVVLLLLASGLVAAVWVALR